MSEPPKIKLTFVDPSGKVTKETTPEELQEEYKQ